MNATIVSLSAPSLFVEWLSSAHFTASRAVASALAFTIAQQSDPNWTLVGNSFTGTWESLIRAAAAFSGSPVAVTFLSACMARHWLVGVSAAEYADGWGWLWRSPFHRVSNAPGSTISALVFQAGGSSLFKDSVNPSKALPGQTVGCDRLQAGKNLPNFPEQ